MWNRRKSVLWHFRNNVESVTDLNNWHGFRSTVDNANIQSFALAPSLGQGVRSSRNLPEEEHQLIGKGLAKAGGLCLWFCGLFARVLTSTNMNSSSSTPPLAQVAKVQKAKSVGKKERCQISKLQTQGAHTAASMCFLTEFAAKTILWSSKGKEKVDRTLS